MIDSFFPFFVSKAKKVRGMEELERRIVDNAWDPFEDDDDLDDF